MGRGQDKTTTGGQWTFGEQQYHINCLEFLGVLHALKALCSADTSVHIQVQSDNTATVCYINNMEGTKQSCDYPRQLGMMHKANKLT